MIQPDRLKSKRYPTYEYYCSGLEAITVRDGDFRHAQLKSRYWWGFKAVYGILLRYLSIFEIRYIFQSTIYFSYVLLAAALVALSTRIALIISPFIVFGVFLSGIPYFSFAPVAPGYILSILAGAVIALLVKGRVSPQMLHLTSFIIGMFSAYFWFVDGHIVLILPLLASVTYFGCRIYADPSESAKRSVSCTTSFVAGFFSSFVLGQLIKAVFLGWDLVMGSAAGAASFHLGHFGTRGGDGLGMLPYFYELAMLGPVVGRIFTTVSLIALLTAAALAIYRSVKARRSDLLLDFLLPFGLFLFACGRFLFGNDDPYYIARFGFVAYALAWASLFAFLVNLRYGDISQTTHENHLEASPRNSS